MGFPEFNVEVATIRCEPSGREARVVHETNLMDAVLQTGLVLGQSCEGIDLCGFCRVRVLEGLENLTPAESEEKKMLAAQHAGRRRAPCLLRPRSRPGGGDHGLLVAQENFKRYNV
jgi:ferredoxin